MDKDGDKKEPMKQAVKQSKMKEELKGNQKKIDKNHNNKIDGQDFAILRAQKNEAYELADGDVTTDTLAGREEGGKSNDVKSFKLKIKGLTPKVPGIVDPEKGMTSRKPYIGNGGEVEIKKGEVVGTFHKEEIELDEKAGYSAKSARAGKDIGKPGKAFAMIAKGAAKRYGSDEAGKRVAGAILAKLRKEELEADWSEEQVDALLEVYENAESPKKNQDIADKSYLKDMGKKPTIKSDLKNFKNFLTGKKETNEETELEEAVSRKDFQLVADLIKTHDNHDKRKELAAHHAEIFHRQNPRFDRAKFMKAANVNEGKAPETDSVPFEQPYNTTSEPVIVDKSGAKHTPMSRARDLARAAMKKVKSEMLGVAPGNNG